MLQTLSMPENFYPRSYKKISVQFLVSIGKFNVAFDSVIRDNRTAGNDGFAIMEIRFTRLNRQGETQIVSKMNC